jgi:hypothetical protein
MQPSPYSPARQLSLDVRSLVAPAGALIAFFGFFMPWIYVSAFIVGRSFSGYELGFIVWPLPLLCIGIALAAFAPYVLRQVPTLVLRIAALGFAGLGLLIILFRLAYLAVEMRHSLASWSVQVGLLITLLGLVLALVGGLLLPAPPKR